MVIFQVFWSKSGVLGQIGRSGKVLGFISCNFSPYRRRPADVLFPPEAGPSHDLVHLQFILFFACGARFSVLLVHSSLGPSDFGEFADDDEDDDDHHDDDDDDDGADYYHDDESDADDGDDAADDDDAAD